MALGLGMVLFVIRFSQLLEVEAEQIRDLAPSLRLDGIEVWSLPLPLSTEWSGAGSSAGKVWGWKGYT